jgi:RNA-binding motif X-linked protein 2
MNVMREITRLNTRELELGISGSASWHHDYRHSAYIFIGGLSPELSEGDVITMFSQFGEVVDLHLPRRKTLDGGQTLGARMGFAFLAYEDQRSTILAIDNMNGWEMKLPRETRPRFLRVDHAGKYRRPKGQQPQHQGGASSEEQAFDDVESNDAAYDERRRQIWDYRKYATLDDGRRKNVLGVGELPPDFHNLVAVEEQRAASAAAIGGAAHANGNDSREDAAHADRVLAMLAEKQRQRERARRGEEDAAAGGAAASSYGGGGGSAASAARRPGTSVGWDDQTRFGDQIVQAARPAAASSGSSATAAATATGSSSRDRDGDERSSTHRERSSSRRSRSRSRSRGRDHRRKRSRSRSRDRHRR